MYTRAGARLAAAARAAPVFTPLRWCYSGGAARASSSSSSATSLAAPAPPPGPTLEQLSPMLDRMDGLAVIGGFDKYGFNVNGVRMRGSVLVFGNFALLWGVGSAVDVSPRSLAPLHMVHPKPELVLVGTGRTTVHVNPAVYAYMARHGIAVEVMGSVRLSPLGTAPIPTQLTISPGPPPPPTPFFFGTATATPPATAGVGAGTVTCRRLAAYAILTTSDIG